MAMHWFFRFGRWLGRVLWILPMALWAAALDPAVLTPIDIGPTEIAGTLERSGDTIRLTAAGTGIGGRSDGFQFVWTQFTNDFDLKFRVSALTATDVLARAGLMVRESLETNAPFLGLFATPTAAGSHILLRSSGAISSPQAGYFPPNLPHSWLRLRRTGELFTGFGSFDGVNWTLISSNSIFLTNSLVGFAATSRNPSVATLAEFSDLADADPTAPQVPLSLSVEPPGPTSRRSAIVVSEVMYHPADRTDLRNGEFVELYNSQPFFEDLSGWRLAGDYEYTLPPNTVIPGGGFLLIAPNPADVMALYGVSNVLGGFTNTLSNSSGEIRLLSERGAVLFELEYRDKDPWPLAADGSGHSLALVHPSYGEADPRAWSASARPGGSPGAWEYADRQSRRQVRLNELLGRAGATGPGPFVELFNSGSQEVDLAGCRLGYHELAPSYVFPAGTRIPARGFLSVTPAELGFALRLDAETLFLRSPAGAADGGAVLDAVRFDPSPAGVSRGRWADGTTEFYELATPTPAGTNAPPRPTEIVFNEIMHSPLTGDADLEYLELHNLSSRTLSLAGWRIEGGVEFTFPPTAQVPAGGFLVVAGNAARLRSVHPELTAATCLGNFQGNLSSRGERLVLLRPEIIPDGAGQRVVLTPADQLTYRSGGQWGQWNDEGGSSLELVDPRANRRWGSNWADSDESRRGQWTTIEATGVLDLGAGNADALQVGLLGEGEALLDNLEVIGPAGTNAVVNGDFEGPTPGFAALGNHIRSSLETTEGDGSSRSLHLRASGNLDTGANRVRFRFPRNLNPGDTYTLRARMRWLKGWPEPLLRVRGNWLEATGRLLVPERAGTPGAANSRRLDNAGPALAEVTHHPVLPAANDAVIVSVQVDDPDGVESVRLHWRVDPILEYSVLEMRDDGAGGDERAGDGRYSATLPGQPNAALVAFWIQATDRAGVPATREFPRNAPVSEALIRYGESAANNAFGTYRLWLTRKNSTTWGNRPNLSNEPVEGTLVYGNFRAIHGAGYRFAGSPYHQQFTSPTSDAHYVWRLPGDDRLLGSDNFNKVHAPGNGPFDDDTTQREQTVYWMARQLGLPWLYRRYVNVYVNGSKRRKLMEDTQVGSGDFISSYFPNDDQGDLFKINPWFEFTSESGTSLNFSNNGWADMNDYRTTGNARKLARYRWNWQPRAVEGTVNDYRRFFALIDAANSVSQEDFIRNLEAEADMTQWLRIFALNHAVGNWDSFGNRNAQNMYAYRPERGRWQLIMWDANIVFGNSGSDGPTGDDLFQYNGADGPMGRIYFTPHFRRMYYQALGEIIAGPMNTNRLSALLDAKFAAFQAAGVSASAPTAIKTWVRSRIGFLNTVLADQAATFTAKLDNLPTGSSPLNLITVSGTAPLAVRTILLNGVPQPVEWTSETDWVLPVVLAAGSNTLRFEGRNAAGEIHPGANRQLTVRFTGTAESAADKIVFTEVQARPPTPGAEYVELLNVSTTQAFDLSGWRLSGLDYTFPPGSILPAGQRWVLAADRAAFLGTYDPRRATLRDVFPGTLSPTGETLRLIRPGTTPEADQTITAVTYQTQDPWPNPPAGSALQLVDPSRSEDERIGNWSFVAPRDPNFTEWKRAQVTAAVGAGGELQLYVSGYPPVTDPLDVRGTYWGSINFGGPVPYGVRFDRNNGELSASFLFDPNDLEANNPMVGVSQNGLDIQFGFDAENRFVGKLSADGTRITGNYLGGGASASFTFARLNPGGSLLLDDVALVRGNTPEAGENLLKNGGFEDSLIGTWQAEGNHADSETTDQQAHQGTRSLLLRGSTGGTGSPTNAVVQTITGLIPGETLTLSYWYLDGTTAQGLMVRLGDGSLDLPVRTTPTKDPHNEYTPGYANTTAGEAPVFGNLWLNEVQPDPTNGAPWLELWNAGSLPEPLDGLYLSDSTGSLTRDAFPSGLSVAPGQFLLVALDGTGTLNVPTDLRTSFRAAPQNGAVFLSRQSGGRTWLVDFLRWGALERARSVGHYPDGSPHADRDFATPTPGKPNSLVVPLLPVWINEWMALNNTIPDPAGSPDNPEFNDWFELYNPNEAPVNLSGFVLSNSPTDQTKFRIPSGYVIPGRGYLLVWADNQSSQNSPQRPDLHVNFRLSGDGEAIALFDPEGKLVDSVSFGPQQANVSEGRATAGGPFVRFPNPTPGTANTGLPPVIAPILALPTLSTTGELTLIWSTQVGRTYQVYSSDDLAGAWVPLAPAFVATSNTGSLTDPAPPPTGRFYHVRVAE